jgi:hypothetical protein
MICANKRILSRIVSRMKLSLIPYELLVEQSDPGTVQNRQFTTRFKPPTYPSLFTSLSHWLLSRSSFHRGTNFVQPRASFQHGAAPPSSVFRFHWISLRISGPRTAPAPPPSVGKHPASLLTTANSAQGASCTTNSLARPGLIRLTGFQGVRTDADYTTLH